jgi:hypothetical protein
MPDGTEREDRANAACQSRALDNFPEHSPLSRRNCVVFLENLSSSNNELKTLNFRWRAAYAHAQNEAFLPVTV